MEPLLTLKQAAHLLGVSMSTIRRRIDQGILRAVCEGSQVRIEPDDLRNYRALLPQKKCRKPTVITADQGCAAKTQVVDLNSGEQR